MILEDGGFVYIPSGAIQVIANASETEEEARRYAVVGPFLFSLYNRSQRRIVTRL